MRAFSSVSARADIREDHEFLDQPMRIEPLGDDDIRHEALLIQHQLSLGQVEISGSRASRAAFSTA